MTVVSVSVSKGQYPVLKHTALKHGVQVDEGFIGDDKVYAQLVGAPYRVLSVGVKAGVRFIKAEDSVEHGEPVRIYPKRPSA